MDKIIYRNVSDGRIDIIVVSGGTEETIGQAYQSSLIKWKLKAYFPVGVADLSRVDNIYDGPIEAGRELVKAWEYYVSLNPLDFDFDKMFDRRRIRKTMYQARVVLL